MSMNIWDGSEREVVCVRNENIRPFCDGKESPLEIGKHYTVVDVEVHSWHTRVYLREFPNRWFNSVLFKEVDGYEHEEYEGEDEDE